MLTPWLMSGLLGLLQYLLRTTASVNICSFVVFVLYQLVRLVALLELAFQGAKMSSSQLFTTPICVRSGSFCKTVQQLSLEAFSATLEYTLGEGQAATSRRCLAADLVQALVTWAASVLNRHTRSSERIRSAQRLSRLYPAVVNRSLIPAMNATSFALLKNSHALNQTTVLVRRYTSLVDDLNDVILGHANRQAEATLPQAVEHWQVPPHPVFPALDRLVQHLSLSSRLPLTEVLIGHLNFAFAELDLAEKGDELLEAVLDAVLAWDEKRRYRY
ncbi:hypothetical protein JCM8097_006628 [Rhodosporidiobolus ruineniae]